MRFVEGCSFQQICNVTGGEGVAAPVILNLHIILVLR